MPVTMVPLKVALGWDKFDCMAFKKIIMKGPLTFTCMIIFLNAQKSIFSYPNATFNGTTVMGRSKAAQNN